MFLCFCDCLFHVVTITSEADLSAVLNGESLAVSPVISSVNGFMFFLLDSVGGDAQSGPEN